MTDPIKIMRRKTWDMRNVPKFRDSGVDGVEVNEVASVDVAHETLEKTKIKIAQ